MNNNNKKDVKVIKKQAPRKGPAYHAIRAFLKGRKEYADKRNSSASC